MTYQQEIINILNQTLQLPAGRLQEDSLLFGNIAELDSMAIVSVITQLESHFDMMVDEEDVTAEHFESVGSLAQLVSNKKAAA
jgi:acyl carrier protein